MNDRELVAFLFRTMLNEEFGTKTDMAEALDVPYRSLQRIFQHLDTAKGASKAFQRIIWYCYDEDIYLTDLLRQFKRRRLEDGEIEVSVKRVSRIGDEERNDHTEPEMEKVHEVFHLLLRTVCEACVQRLTDMSADCIVTHIAHALADRRGAKPKKDEAFVQGRMYFSPCKW